MKNNKKIILAAGAAALGLVAATGVTSGFAWFATNSTVTVSGFNFKADSNNEFLLIGTGETNTIAKLRDHANGTKPNKSVTISEDVQEYKPVTYLVDDVVVETVNQPIGATQTATNYTTDQLDDKTNWGKAASDVWDDAAISTVGTALGNSDTLSDYVGIYTFYLGLEANSADVNGIYIRSVDFTNGNKGATVIIAGSQGGVLYTEDSSTPSQVNITGALHDDDANPVVVKAYVYFEGRNTAVKSSQATTLADTLTFTLGTNYNA